MPQFPRRHRRHHLHFPRKLFFQQLIFCPTTRSVQHYPPLSSINQTPNLIYRPLTRRILHLRNPLPRQIFHHRRLPAPAHPHHRQYLCVFHSYQYTLGEPIKPNFIWLHIVYSYCRSCHGYRSRWWSDCKRTTGYSYKYYYTQ